MSFVLDIQGEEYLVYVFIFMYICTLISNLSGRPNIFLGSGTLKNIRLHPTYFFQGLDHIFPACNLLFKKEEARLYFLN